MRFRGEFNKALIVQWKDADPRRLPMLMGIEGRLSGAMAHPDFNMSYGPWEPEKFDVLHEVVNPTEKDLDALVDKMFKDYAPKPEPPSARLGWIAPDGRFFPCAYCAHRDAAEWLVATQFTEEERMHLRMGLGGNKEALERNGWLALQGGVILLYDEKHDMVHGNYPDPIMRTVVALHAAFDLADDKGEDIEDLVRANPEGYVKQQGWSAADEDGGILRCLEQCIEMHASSAVKSPDAMDFPEQVQVARDPLANLPLPSKPKQFRTGD